VTAVSKIFYHTLNPRRIRLLNKAPLTGSIPVTIVHALKDLKTANPILAHFIVLLSNNTTTDAAISLIEMHSHQSSAVPNLLISKIE
jgi:hypothetical protein